MHLSDLGAPKIVQKLDGPALADSVSIDRSGTLVAVEVNPAGDGVDTPLWRYRFERGGPVDDRPAVVPGWTRGHRLIDTEFHPSRSMLA